MPLRNKELIRAFAKAIASAWLGGSCGLRRFPPYDSRRLICINA